jgi:hypothetical protein
MVVVAVVLVLVDLATTLIGVRMAGPDIEANGLHHRLLARHGVVAFTLVYLAGAGLMVLLLAQVDGALVGVVGVLTLVAVNNLVALVRVRRSRRR